MERLWLLMSNSWEQIICPVPYLRKLRVGSVSLRLTCFYSPRLAVEVSGAEFIMKKVLNLTSRVGNDSCKSLLLRAKNGTIVALCHIGRTCTEFEFQTKTSPCSRYARGPVTLQPRQTYKSVGNYIRSLRD